MQFHLKRSCSKAALQSAACQVPPFPVTQPYVTEINGVKLASYFDWMKTCYMITATSHPAIARPRSAKPVRPKCVG